MEVGIRTKKSCLRRDEVLSEEEEEEEEEEGERRVTASWLKWERVRASE